MHRLSIHHIRLMRVITYFVFYTHTLTFIVFVASLPTNPKKLPQNLQKSCQNRPVRQVKTDANVCVKLQAYCAVLLHLQLAPFSKLFYVFYTTAYLNAVDPNKKLQVRKTRIYSNHMKIADLNVGLAVMCLVKTNNLCDVVCSYLYLPFESDRAKKNPNKFRVSRQGRKGLK